MVTLLPSLTLSTTETNSIERKKYWTKNIKSDHTNSARSPLAFPQISSQSLQAPMNDLCVSPCAVVLRRVITLFCRCRQMKILNAIKWSINGWFGIHSVNNCFGFAQNCLFAVATSQLIPFLFVMMMIHSFELFRMINVWMKCWAHTMRPIDLNQGVLHCASASIFVFPIYSRMLTHVLWPNRTVKRNGTTARFHRHNPYYLAYEKRARARAHTAVCVRVTHTNKIDWTEFSKRNANQHTFSSNSSSSTNWSMHAQCSSCGWQMALASHSVSRCVACCLRESERECESVHCIRKFYISIHIFLQCMHQMHNIKMAHCVPIFMMHLRRVSKNKFVNHLQLRLDYRFKRSDPIQAIPYHTQLL